MTIEFINDFEEISVRAIDLQIIDESNLTTSFKKECIRLGLKRLNKKLKK